MNADIINPHVSRIQQYSVWGSRIVKIDWKLIFSFFFFCTLFWHPPYAMHRLGERGRLLFLYYCFIGRFFCFVFFFILVLPTKRDDIIIRGPTTTTVVKAINDLSSTSILAPCEIYALLRPPVIIPLSPASRGPPIDAFAPVFHLTPRTTPAWLWHSDRVAE